MSIISQEKSNILSKSMNHSTSLSNCKNLNQINFNIPKERKLR